MTDTRITRPRRIFVEYIGKVGKCTFKNLKKALVGKGENKMDTTTLYRMIDIFEKKWIIHQIPLKWDKIIILSEGDFSPDIQSVTITACENCGRIETKYALMNANLSSSTTYNYRKSCEHCLII